MRASRSAGGIAAAALETADHAVLVERLGQAIAARARDYFPEVAGDVRVRPSRQGRPWVRPHSVMFEFTVETPGSSIQRGVFVKIPRRADAEAVRQLHETLTRLHAFAATLSEEMNVVRPLDCFPEHRALVTERVDGVRLEVLLRAGGARRHGELLHDCGRFLRAYHERLGQLARQRDTASTFMHRCGAYLARLEQGGVDARTREHLRAGFEHAVLRLPAELPSCLTFDDYSVRNLLVRGRRFFLVEAPLPRQKLIYDDLACFLVSLTMVFWGTPWFLLGAVPPPALGRRFLEGYFADAAPDPMIALFCAKNLCFRWCRALDTLSGRTSRIAGALYSTLLPRHVNRVFFQHVMTHLQQATGAGGDRSALPARRP